MSEMPKPWMNSLAVEKARKSGESYRMKQEGLTFTEIGRRLGISWGQAKELAATYERDYLRLEEPLRVLSLRSVNALLSSGLFTVEQVRNANFSDLARAANVGQKTICEIREAAGLPQKEELQQSAWDSLSADEQRAVVRLRSLGWTVTPPRLGF